MGGDGMVEVAGLTALCVARRTRASRASGFSCPNVGAESSHGTWRQRTPRPD